MNVVYEIEGLRVEWDSNKARMNIAKHGVSFEEAAEVFLDPLCLYDDASIESESRDFVMGFSFAKRLLFVVHIERGERIRIISARLATTYERTQYEES